MANDCPVCSKRVSNWEMASGKTTLVNGHVVHKACLQDKSVQEVERLTREANHGGV